MNKEQQKEFDLKCALFFKLAPTIRDNKIFVDGQEFDPYNDANDRNKVIEKMGIATNWRKDDIGNITWDCTFIKLAKLFTDEDMEAAQIACIAAVLEIKQ